MLSRNKAAVAVAAWIRDRLEETTDRSLVDDTHGPSLIVSSATAERQAITLETTVIDGDERADYKFVINVGMDLSHLLGKPGEPSPP